MVTQVYFHENKSTVTYKTFLLKDKEYLIRTHNMLAEKNPTCLTFARYPPIPEGEMSELGWLVFRTGETVFQNMYLLIHLMLIMYPRISFVKLYHDYNS